MLNDKENINSEQEAHHLHSTVKCFLFPSLLSNCNYSLLKLKQNQKQTKNPQENPKRICENNATTDKDN